MVRTAAGTLTVNAANLDFHLAIPFIAKPGRGVPFTSGTVYNSDAYAIYSGKWWPVQSMDVPRNDGGIFDGWLATGTASGGYVT